MTLFKISYVVDGLEDVLRDGTNQIKIGEVTFHYRENEILATTILESNQPDSSNVLKQALYLIDRALGMICFSHNTEGSIEPSGFYVTDLSNNPNISTVRGTFTLRRGYLKENSQVTLSKIDLLPEQRKKVLDLSLKYYKLSHIKNPVRIQTLFSSISVIIRDLTGNDFLPTPVLKEEIRSILCRDRLGFDSKIFDNLWEECYTFERDSIAHGRESALVDIANLRKYNELANVVGGWTRLVIYYYIDNYQIK